MSESSNSINLLIIHNVSVIPKKQKTKQMMVTTKNETVKKIFTTIDTFTAVVEKQIGGDIVRQIFHAIASLNVTYLR